MKINALRPSPIVALQTTATTKEAASYMAAKRQDACLVTDTEGHLLGIITDKDLTYRLVAESLPVSTQVSEIMTKDPISVEGSQNASDALNKMVAVSIS